MPVSELNGYAQNKLNGGKLTNGYMSELMEF